MFLSFNIDMKSYFVGLLFFIIIVTVGLCIIKPKMHKYFSLNIIEYAIKFNKGQMETVKTITENRLEER